MEKSELTSKLSKYKKELKKINEYKEEIKKIFDFKTLKVSMNKFNKIWSKKEELTTIIYDFLKNLRKKNQQSIDIHKRGVHSKNEQFN